MLAPLKLLLMAQGSGYRELGASEGLPWWLRKRGGLLSPLLLLLVLLGHAGGLLLLLLPPLPPLLLLAWVQIEGQQALGSAGPQPVACQPL